METDELMNKLRELDADDLVQETTPNAEMDKKTEEVRALFIWGVPDDIEDLADEAEWNVDEPNDDKVVFSRSVQA